MEKINKCKIRCEVISCYNNKKHNQTSMIHSFYGIPRINRQEARQEWLSAINITEEYLTSTKIKRHFLCDRHFCSNDFGEKHLRYKAVPSLYLNEVCPPLLSTMTIKSESCNDVDFSNNIPSTVNPLVLVYSSAEVQTDEKDFVEKVTFQCCIESAENEKMYKQRIGFLQTDFQMKIEKKDKIVEALKLRVENLKLQNKTKCADNRLLKRKAIRDGKKMKELIEFKKKDMLERVDELTYLNTNEKSFCKLLLKNKFNFSPSDQFIVKTIHDRSPLLYRYLRDTLKIKFPCLQTIRSWGYTSFKNLDINNEVVE